MSEVALCYLLCCCVSHDRVVTEAKLVSVQLWDSGTFAGAGTSQCVLKGGDMAAWLTSVSCRVLGIGPWREARIRRGRKAPSIRCSSKVNQPVGTVQRLTSLHLSVLPPEKLGYRVADRSQAHADPALVSDTVLGKEDASRLTSHPFTFALRGFPVGELEKAR
jgi:hypothetical protein